MGLFTGRELRLIGLVVGSVTVLSVVVATLVSLSRTPAPPRDVPPVTTPRFELSVSDLAFPDELRDITFSEWLVFRPPLDRWNREQIERFWIDPELIRLERLEAENDEKILRIFETVR
jgi:hypothetical protein